MSTLYFVDSENVGDCWTFMLDNVDADDKIIVFYTKRSPHMNYCNLVHLKTSPKDVIFIECFEGNNALDFQLVSELGYRIATNSGDEYVIVSNDTGFDAAVKYWKKNDTRIRRITSKACMSAGTMRKFDTLAQKPTVTDKQDESKGPSLNELVDEAIRQVQATKDRRKAAKKANISLEDAIQAAPLETSLAKDDPSCTSTTKAKKQSKKAASKAASSAEDSATDVTDNSDISDKSEDTSQSNAQMTAVSDASCISTGGSAAAADATSDGYSEDLTVTDDAKEVLYCVGKENLANLHEALMQMYGNIKCKFLYNTFKSDPAYNTYIADHKHLSTEEKQNEYCHLAFKAGGSETECPDDFAQVVMRSRDGKKNLNSLRATLQNKYGKDNGLKFYSLIKTHVKVLDNIL